MLIIGIDPGKSGGIGFVRPPEAACAIKMPDTIKDAWDEFNYLTGPINKIRKESDEDTCFAFLEQVWGMKGDGAAAAFTFGRNYGQLEMALHAAGIPYDYVTPVRWQKEFSLIKKKGESKTSKKNRHKSAAQRLFPHLKITHAIADAILIAEYGQRLKLNQLQA